MHSRSNKPLTANLPASPVGDEKRNRVEVMMQALQEALDKVYDPDGEGQLRRLARDYCQLLEQTACGQEPCSGDHLRQDCPLAEEHSVPATDRKIKPAL